MLWPFTLVTNVVTTPFQPRGHLLPQARMTAGVCQKAKNEGGDIYGSLHFIPLFLFRSVRRRRFVLCLAERSHVRVSSTSGLRLIIREVKSSKHEQHRTQSISGHRSPCPYNFGEVTKCSLCQFALGDSGYIPQFNGPHDEPTICFNWWKPSG